MATGARRSVRNLSGSWQGEYRYPWGATVPFLACITQTEGAIWGDTVEPKGGRFGFRTAKVSGGCGGKGVQFTKNYLQPSASHRNPVVYEGQVSDDRKTITGRWLVLGVSGTFHMERDAEIEDETDIQERVSLDIKARVVVPVSGGGA